MTFRLYQTQIRQTYYGQNMVTTFYHWDEVTGAVGAAPEIALAVATDIVPLLNACQSPRVANDSVYCLDLGNGIDSSTIGVSGEGTLSGAASTDLPPFMTVGIRWRPQEVQAFPEAPDMKRGFTRISGLQDEQILAGIAIASGLLVSLEALTDELLLPITTDDGTYNLALHRRDKAGTPPILQQVAVLVGVNGYKLGTQNTRK